MWLDFLILFMFEILDNMRYLDMLLVNILRAKFSQMAIDLWKLSPIKNPLYGIADGTVIYTNINIRSIYIHIHSVYSTLGKLSPPHSYMPHDKNDIFYKRMKMLLEVFHISRVIHPFYLFSDPRQEAEDH